MPLTRTPSHSVPVGSGPTQPIQKQLIDLRDLPTERREFFADLWSKLRIRFQVQRQPSVPCSHRLL